MKREVFKTKILRELDKLRREISIKKLADRLHVRHREEFSSLLLELCEEGRVKLSAKGKVRLIENEPLTRAEMISYSDGYSFARPAEGGEDVFIPASKRGDALPGDTVMLRVRMEERGPAGEVAQISQRGEHPVYGRLVRLYDRLVLEADSAYRVPIAVISAAGIEEGDKVSARVISDGHKGVLTCEIIEIFGDSESARVCADAIISKAGIPVEFPEGVLECARRAAGRGIDEQTLRDRADLRTELTMTIDGADAKDIDDAFGVRRTETGYELSIHIADVTHYAALGDECDIEARRRGTSVYFADRVIPMYPTELSNGACSLNAGEDKLTVSVIISMDSDGGITDYRFENSVIRSDVRGVYSEVNSILRGSADDILREKYSAVTDMLEVGCELYEKLSSRADKRGAIGFETRELTFSLDENGVCSGVSVRESGQAESMIEQFMIAANVCAARAAKENGLSFVFRIHEEPSAQKLDEAAEALEAFGLDTRKLRDRPQPSYIAQLLKEVSGEPYERMISQRLLRAMAKARYCAENKGHYGLALRDYCHFTSPIRRYPDCVVHRMLKYMLKERDTSCFDSYVRESAQLSSDFEQRAVDAERKAEACYSAEYMRAHIGEVFGGVISAVTAFGVFVELECGIEGLVRLESLNSRAFIDRKGRLCRSGAELPLGVGDSVRCEVSGCCVSLGTIDLRLV